MASQWTGRASTNVPAPPALCCETGVLDITRLLSKSHCGAALDSQKRRKDSAESWHTPYARFPRAPASATAMGHLSHASMTVIHYCSLKVPPLFGVLGFPWLPPRAPQDI